MTGATSPGPRGWRAILSCLLMLVRRWLFSLFRAVVSPWSPDFDWIEYQTLPPEVPFKFQNSFWHIMGGINRINRNVGEFINLSTLLFVVCWFSTKWISWATTSLSVSTDVLSPSDLNCNFWRSVDVSGSVSKNLASKDTYKTDNYHYSSWNYLLSLSQQVPSELTCISQGNVPAICVCYYL